MWLVISTLPAILTKCLSLDFLNHTLQQQITPMPFPSSKWCSWMDLSCVSWLDVHVVLARNLASHHKLAVAITNEVVSYRNEQSCWEKSSLTFSMPPDNQMQTKPFFKEIFNYMSGDHSFFTFCSQKQKCWNITKMFSYWGQSAQ